MNTEKPKRKKHSYTQSLLSPPGKVFPLLCPVMEEKWVPGWVTEKVISNTGVAEKNCVFITPFEPNSAIWIVTKHDPVLYQVEMYKVTPDHTVGKLEISLLSDGSNKTRATISYEFTVIGLAGEKFLKEFTHEWYVDFMKNWEKAMNHYLNTGNKIT
jgi:hypothetical protein